MDEVRNTRNARFLWLDNEVLTDYGEDLGPYGIAVYTALAYRADRRTQACYPGKADLAHLTGMSKSQVKRELNKLERLGLISIEPRRDEKGHWKTNLYTLLDVKARPQVGSEGTQGVGSHRPQVGSEGTQGVGSHRPQVGSGRTINNNHEQESHKTTTDPVVVADEEEKLPMDLVDSLNAIHFQNDRLTAKLGLLYAENPDTARALVNRAIQTADNPPAFLAKALQEDWHVPVPGVDNQEPELYPDPDCPVCGGLGRLLDANDEWLICECCKERV